MTNLEFLNFNFVDRESERESANAFLKSQNDVRVLNVIGEKNAGKNFFIDEVIKENSSKTFLTIDLENLNQASPYGELIEKLETVRNGEFFQNIKKNYSKVLKTSTKGVSAILDICPDLSVVKILNCMLDTGVLFLNNSCDNQESPVKMVCKYFKEISKYEELVIVVKNLTSCEDMYIDPFLEIILSTVEDLDVDIKFVLSVDKSKLNNNDKIHDFLYYKISFIPIKIEHFTDPELFFKMLFGIFNFTAEDKNSIDHVFNICNGYPGELKRLLSNAYFEYPDIVYRELGKLEWDDKIITKSINKKQVPSFKNKIDKIVFLSVLFLEIELTSDFLINISKYICKKLFISVIENRDIENSISSLIHEYGLLEMNFSDTGNRIISAGDNKDLYYETFQNDNILPLFSKCFCDLLLKEENQKFLISKNDKYYTQLAWHTYKSRYNHWEELNLNIGKYFYKKNQISVAYQIFVRIEKYWNKLSLDDKFVVSSCFYAIGNYQLAYKIIYNIDIEQCNYEQLILKSKILNINMDKIGAVQLLKNMLNKVEFKSNRYEIIDMMQRFLSNIEAKRDEAKLLFDGLLEQFKKGKTENYTNFLISSMEYYRGDIVQNNFKFLEKEYLKTNNKLMLTELWVNEGFDLFWQGKIDEAEKKFKESITNFESMRIHELSYVLNNLANCLMMKGDFSEAISSLRRGLTFNKSKYAEIVLKTHLMICYAIKNNKEYLPLFIELEKYITKNDSAQLDISIYLKVNYSLGVVQELCGNNAKDILYKHNVNYIDNAIQIANSHNHKTLPYLWFKDWNEDVDNDITRRIDHEAYFDFYEFRFEPWLMTITHD